jgi:hypothetical protein
MLTLFTTAKPFTGHSGVIQRNALKSWTLLHPQLEVILFGNDQGAREIAQELGLLHVPEVKRNDTGAKRIDDLFRQAQSISRHDLLCYCNCDIILMQDFRAALERVAHAHRTFLMVGRRWDTDITQPLDFADPLWQRHTQQLAHEKGTQQPAWSVDYFAFRRGLYPQIPPLVIGRIWWDHWLVWKARQEGADVVDCSPVVRAVHQNHDYSYHPDQAKGVWTDELAKHNYELAGGRGHLYTIDDATHILTPEGEKSNVKRWWAPHWRYLRPKLAPMWFAALDATRPLRQLLGLRKTHLAELWAKLTS